MLPIVSLELGQATDLDNLNNLDKPKATSFPSLINRANHADPEATHLIINVKKILAVVNATYAVAKRKPEKIRLAGIRTLTSAIPVQRSNQLS